MKNYYYSFEINLENDHVKSKLDTHMAGLITPNTTELAINSRFFNDSHACFAALNEDLNSKVLLLDVKHISDGSITSINETNPFHTNSKEDLEEYKKDNPDFEEYLEGWEDHEIMRLTFTTEEFDEEQPPIINDEKAMMFRYVMHALDDDMDVPDGKTLIENASSMLH